MIVFEHDHARQVVPVGVDTPNEHPVLLHKPEPGRRLARPRDDALVARRAREVLYLLRSTPASAPSLRAPEQAGAVRGNGERLKG